MALFLRGAEAIAATSAVHCPQPDMSVQGVPRRNTPPPRAAPKPLSESEAIARVARLPDVAAWMARMQREAPTNRAGFEVVETTPQQYVIRAYEAVNRTGEPGYLATYGWYAVDRYSGKVTRTLP